MKTRRLRGSIYNLRPFLLCLTLLSFKLEAQVNLVVNPGFEDSIPLPPSRGCNTKMLMGYSLTHGWYQVGGSADHYNSDLSRSVRKLRVHKARSGQGRLALVLAEDPQKGKYYREFVQTRLKAPLKKDALYSVNFFVVRDNRSVFCAPEIGAYFSPLPVYAQDNYVIPMAQAQVKSTDYQTLTEAENWSLVHGYYKAHGGEQYITLGNFGDYKPSVLDSVNIPSKLFRNDFGWYAYYYFDDVYVYEVADTLRDDVYKVIPLSPMEKPFNNMVFVLDVSASMQKEDKIKMLKQGVDQFVSSLDTNEVVSLVTFDAVPRVLARHLKTSQKHKIISAIDSLKTGGGTNVNVAILKAYSLIDSSYIQGGNNRVILITDAGFQVSDHMKKVIREHAAEKNVGFSTLVFDDEKFHQVRKLCRNNKGSYENVKADNAGSALRSQVRERKIVNYGPGRKKTFTHFTVRLILCVLIIGLIYLKYHK